MAFQTVVPNVLLRTNRPGWKSKNVKTEVVDDWISEAKGQGVRTILCLLDGKLDYYKSVGNGGLLGRYRDAGFHVIHRPTRDYSIPPVQPEMLERIASDFLAADLPLLVHCSAGVGRTGAVIDYLTREMDLPALRKSVEQVMQQYSDGRGSTHFRHVTYLALRLYDQLDIAKSLPPRYRSVLWAASMLHDIGVDLPSPPRGHARRSGRAILELSERSDLSFDGTGLMDASQVATVAALHGIDGASEEDPLGLVDDRIASLWTQGEIPEDLLILSGILRVADGLDRRLSQKVADIAVSGSLIQVRSEAGYEPDCEINRANEKARLLRKVTGIEWRIVPCTGAQTLPME
ncbi:HD domain-containing protein [bacterium]|nr:HD domain-containing protein [bacterium]